MATKHTPGPWVVRGDERNLRYIDAPNSDPTLGHVSWEELALVFGCDDDPSGDDVAEANARLIAAAPDLFILAEYVYERTSIEGEPCPWCSTSPHRSDCSLARTMERLQGGGVVLALNERG